MVRTIGQGRRRWVVRTVVVPIHGGATIYDIEIRTLEEQDTAVVHRKVSADELTSWLSGVFGTLATHLQRIGVATAGLPFALFHQRGDSMDVEAGFPVAERITPKDEVQLSSLPGGVAAVTWHRGHPDQLDGAFEAVDAWLQRQGVESVGAPWVVYHRDPETQPEEETWMAEVVQPYRE